jgi:hypothetical protein
MDDKKGKTDPKAGSDELKIEIMDDKYTSIQDLRQAALRQAILRACKNIIKLEKEIKRNKDIVWKIKEFLIRNDNA